MKWLRIMLFTVAVVAIMTTASIMILPRLYPLHFTHKHSHCISATGFGFRMYSADHNGRFPENPRGYGDALLLVLPYIGSNSVDLLTGPGYDGGVFRQALATSQHVPEEECGRVYIPGLTDQQSNAWKLVMFYDKMPTYGGDHGPPWGALGREVLYIDSHHDFIRESNWTSFKTNQIALLVEAGFPISTAKWYYAQQPKKAAEGLHLLFSTRK